jgi:hypothetical protein
VTAKQTTNLVVASATVGLLAYELWTLANRESGDTISESIHSAARSQPLTLIAASALVVHCAGGSPKLQRAAARHPLISVGAGGLVGLLWSLKGMKTT